MHGMNNIKINWPAFITEMEIIYWAVRTEHPNVIQINPNL